MWGHGFAMLPNPAPVASFSGITTSIRENSTRSITLVTEPSSVRVRVETSGSLGLGNCSTTSKDSVGNGKSIILRGCSEGDDVLLKLYRASDGILLRIYEIDVTADSDPSPSPTPVTPTPLPLPTSTPTPTPPPPPRDLVLSTVSGEPNQIQLTFTRSGPPHNYVFQLQGFNPDTNKWGDAGEVKAQNSPAIFENIPRGYKYQAKGTNCHDKDDTDSCVLWTGWTNTLELSNPTVAFAGLASRLQVSESDGFQVRASDLTLEQQYTVALRSTTGAGFNSSCTRTATRTFTASSRSVNHDFTLYGCSKGNATVTATLHKGSASGTVLGTVSRRVSVTNLPGPLRDYQVVPGDEAIYIGWLHPIHLGNPEYTGYTLQYKTGTGGWVTDSSNIAIGTTRYLIPDLTNGTSYQVRVAAKSNDGLGPWSTSGVIRPVDGPRAPSAPQDMNAYGRPGGKIVVNWGHSVDRGNPQSTAFRIEYRKGTTGDWTLWRTIYFASVQTHITGLEDRVRYQVRVGSATHYYDEATDSVVRVGAWAVDDFAIPDPLRGPSYPTNIRATAGDRQLSLTWDLPTDPGRPVVSDYDIRYRTETTGGAIGGWRSWSHNGDHRTATITGLRNGQQYLVEIMARNNQNRSHLFWGGHVYGTPQAP